jgi:Cd2+/Zn2+-exporting ATPase
MAKRTQTIVLEKLHCASCASEIEDNLHKMNGVSEAKVLFGASKVDVSYDDAVLDHNRLEKQLNQLGHNVVHPEAPEPKRWQSSEVILTGLSGLLLAIGLLIGFPAQTTTMMEWGWWSFSISTFFYLAGAAFGGIEVAKAGWNAIKERRLGINGLMGIAIIGAVVIGEFVEAASLAFLFSLAELLEQYAVDRARRSLRELLNIAPQQATVVRDGQAEVLPIGEVVVGDIVEVRPGEKIPLDGTVIAGQSSVNQAPITGESLPIDKMMDDGVYAGSLNEEGFLEIRVDKAYRDTTLAKIIHLVERAETQRAPTERAIERFGRVYTPAVVALAALVAVIPPLLFAQAWNVWLLRAITLLVISCPCALLISTPVSVVSAITAAARYGVLIKGGRYLEAIGKAKVIALDKTGTLTKGTLKVQEVVPLNGKLDSDQLLNIAASLEAKSKHPIAQAIVHASNGHPLQTVDEFKSLTGHGVEGDIDGTRYRVGKREMFSEFNLDAVMPTSQTAKTVVVVGQEDHAVGVITVSDELRPDAYSTVQALKQSGLKTVMITGDHEDIAKQVAQKLDIDVYYAGVLPDQKLDTVKALEAEYGPVIMVGDGVNDAPALAGASVGVAMGAAGTDTALETADIALLSDDLTKLPYLIQLSRKARRVIGQNVTVSLATKLLLSVGVLPGFVTLVAAVLIGDMGTTLAVTGNALRLGKRPSSLKK